MVIHFGMILSVHWVSNVTINWLATLSCWQNCQDLCPNNPFHGISWNSLSHLNETLYKECIHGETLIYSSNDDNCARRETDCGSNGKVKGTMQYLNGYFAVCILPNTIPFNQENHHYEYVNPALIQPWQRQIPKKTLNMFNPRTVTRLIEPATLDPNLF